MRRSRNRSDFVCEILLILLADMKWEVLSFRPQTAFCVQPFSFLFELWQNQEATAASCTLNTTEKDEEETERATVSIADAEDVDVDVGVAAVLAITGGIFTLKEQKVQKV